MSSTEVLMAKQVGSEPIRRRLPDERRSITHEFQLEGGHIVTITAGMRESGELAEIFLRASKEGSTLSGFLDAFALSISWHLQNGVPLKKLVTKFANVRFEPNGRTNNPCITTTSSLLDYIFRWLGMKFLSMEELKEIGILTKCHDCGKTVKCGDRSFACIAVALKLVS